mgnify:CR=1 FL=1
MATATSRFLKYAFSKLLVNFTWWVNRKDRAGANVFEGGFLGLDNIGVFDRSSPLPTGGYLDQADGTAWMVFFSQQMLRIAVELALHEPLYEEFVEKFFQHTLFIAGAMDRVGERHDEMWDEEDGFFYDVLRFPDGSATRLKVRSIVGLLPLAAVAVFEEDILEKLPKFRERARAFGRRHPELVANMHLPDQAGVVNRRMLSIVDEKKLRRILARMLDEAEFFGPAWHRALSRFHLDHPYVFQPRRAGASRGLRAGRFRHRACSAATPTGAGRCGCPSTSCCTPRCCVSTPTTARTSRSSARPAPGG